ncbi:MAG TPA: alpha-hydroxy acid oxidase, partial [Sphingomonadaceae bacterium]|nr:alpha-hydroxy acid oxidase [Sphingomonadaceae bacterium]
MGRIVTVSDLRDRARRRLPRFIDGFLEGGAGAENGLARNRAALDRVTLLPRYLVNIEERSTAVSLFGRRWSAPIGAAPIGMANLIWPGADRAIARACGALGLPATISTAASTSLEAFRAEAGEHGWFMLYPGRAEAVVADLVDRADQAGYDVLLVTVDVPLASVRPRERRSGFVAPLRVTPALALDALRHPAWALATLRHGVPQFANMARYAGAGSDTNAQAAYIGRQTTGRFDWERLAALRARWPRTLVAKGILSPADAEKAKALG